MKLTTLRSLVLIVLLALTLAACRDRGDKEPTVNPGSPAKPTPAIATPAPTLAPGNQTLTSPLQSPSK